MDNSRHLSSHMDEASHFFARRVFSSVPTFPGYDIAIEVMRFSFFPRNPSKRKEGACSIAVSAGRCERRTRNTQELPRGVANKPLAT
eukprot:513754-Pyramimonas_sp.AAC.1